ncbi:hypothetical protein GCM10022243_57300 [Saccharothrix violaceirubra]
MADVAAVPQARIASSGGIDRNNDVRHGTGAPTTAGEWTTPAIAINGAARADPRSSCRQSASIPA